MIVLFIFLLDYVNGGELFTHLYQREKFTEEEVRIYIGEIVVALEHLHRVRTFVQGFCLQIIFDYLYKLLARIKDR
jgi:serine/threonine protein kinase